MIVEIQKIAIIFLALTLFACQSKKYEIPQEVKDYVDQFWLEADRKGIEIPAFKDDLLITWGDLSKSKKGQCQPQGQPKKIILDRKSWNVMDDYQRKVVVFHEMAHCFLGRTKHRNEILSRGDCASLLNGSENGFNCFCNLYSQAWQEYYVEEIFDENTAAPGWYSQDTSYYLEDTLLSTVLDSMATYFYLASESDLKRDFQIESIYPQGNPTHSNLSIANYGINVDTKKMSITLFGPGKMTIPIEQTNIQIDPEDQVKLTIRWWRDFIYFFCNEKLIHKSDYQYPLKTSSGDQKLIRSDTIAAYYSLYQSGDRPKMQLTISDLK